VDRKRDYVFLKNFLLWLTERGVKMRVIRKMENISTGNVFDDLTLTDLMNLPGIYVGSSAYKILGMLKRIPTSDKCCLLCGTEELGTMLEAKGVGKVHEKCLNFAKNIDSKYPLVKLFLDKMETKTKVKNDKKTR